MLAVITWKQNRLKQIFSNLPALQQKPISQFAGFIVVGAIATIAHYLTLIILVEFCGVNSLISSSVGFLFGAITGFNLNRKFVFADQNSSKTALLKYLSMASAGAVLNLGLFWTLTELLNLHYLAAQAISTIGVMTANFTCCKLWIFKKVN